MSLRFGSEVSSPATQLGWLVQANNSPVDHVRIMTSTPDLQLVCLLDVLGFESLLQHLGLTGLHAKYASLVAYVKEQTGGVDIVPTPGGHVGVGWLVVGNAYFSDTVLFWTKYSKMALPSFTHLVAEAICFGLETELPFRGAIAVGEALFDSTSGMFLGQPLVEVARTEREQQWIGVSFGPSFSKPGLNEGFQLHTVLPFKSITRIVTAPMQLV
ncbi:MAG: hypothetical protein JWM21_4159 [Acidobacteria bacterium]|nr:hypothetical protein [Acidobacteriota bacterium]